MRITIFPKLNTFNIWQMDVSLSSLGSPEDERTWLLYFLFTPSPISPSLVTITTRTVVLRIAMMNHFISHVKGVSHPFRTFLSLSRSVRLVACLALTLTSYEVFCLQDKHFLPNCLLDIQYRRKHWSCVFCSHPLLSGWGQRGRGARQNKLWVSKWYMFWLLLAALE